MKNVLFIAIIFLIFTGIVSCIEPFDPPEIASPDRIIVIEGVLDAPDGHAKVMLSRIRNINSPLADSLSSRITNALVRILLNDVAYTLDETTNPGVYEAVIPANSGSSAQLVIQAGGNTYESEVVTIKPVPEIDSVTYTADDRGVTIEVTTHDPSNSTKYYQWSYEETAQYEAIYGATFYYDGMEVYPYTDEQFRKCWISYSSSNILVATTDGLTEDVIYKYPIIKIPDDSWKKDIAYSALVSQYSISEDTFVFLRELENNTENVGSLFDPQPGRIFGNIENVSDPLEYVIGQFSARSVSRKRLFIRSAELPDYPRSFTGCSLLELDTISVEELYSLTRPKELSYAITTPMGAVVGYTYSRPSCMDCRLVRDGSNTEPEFWQ